MGPHPIHPLENPGPSNTLVSCPLDPKAWPRVLERSSPLSTQLRFVNVTLFLVTGPGDALMKEEMRGRGVDHCLNPGGVPNKNLSHDQIDSVDAGKQNLLADLSGEMIECKCLIRMRGFKIL